MRIAFTNFGGIIPRVDPTLLPGNAAQKAEAVNLSGGVLNAWRNHSSVEALVNTGTIRTIFLYDDLYWLEWEADVNVVLGLVSGDTTGRFYYTGDGIPKKSNLAEATTGAGALPINFYPMGLPVPHAALTAVTAGGGSGDDRDIQYVWTVVSSWSEESAPSQAMSSAIVAKDGDTVNLSEITMIWAAGEAYTVNDWVYPTADEGGDYVYKCVVAGTSDSVEPSWGETVDGDTDDNTCTWRCYENNIYSKNIYRYATGEVGGAYQYVGSIDMDETTYADTVLDSALGSSLPDVDYVPPVEGLTGIISMTSGIIAGFSGKDLYFCEPYKPWAWPAEYNLSFPDAIVALISLGSTVAVLTEGRPWLVTGTHPLSMTPTPLPQSAACLAKRGAVSHGTFGAFPGPDGIYFINDSECKRISTKHWTPQQWEDLYPTTFHAKIWNNKYFAFYSYGSTEGGIIFDIDTGELVTLDFYTSASFRDPQTSKLYYVVDVDGVMTVYQWEGDTTQPKGDYTWKSKVFLLPVRKTFSAGRVIFQSADRAAYLDLVNDRLATIARNNAKIAAAAIGGAIAETYLGEDMELNGDELEDVADEVTYTGDDTLTLNLYVSGTFTWTKEIYDDRPFRLPGDFKANRWEFELIGNVKVESFAIADTMRELKAMEG